MPLMLCADLGGAPETDLALERDRQSRLEMLMSQGCK